MEFTTLCYLERDNHYLMLHRTKKEHDFNKDMWIGVGGHFEENESPDECLLREVKEETAELPFTQQEKTSQSKMVLRLLERH